MTPALLAGSVAAPALPVAQADACPSVDVTFARGTGQTSGLGAVGQAFVDSLRSQVGGRSMDVYPVNYPATIAFASSAQTGADDVVAHVNEMMARCPSTRLVLGGFSQGAGVMDLATPALPPQANDHVAAIAVLGNPISPLAVNLSGAQFAPIGPPYSVKTIDLCNGADPVCSGGGDVNAHRGYVESGMVAQAASFVAGRL
jgi:cutinase